MPNYAKLKVAELRQMSLSRGLQVEGLKKAEIIQMLKNTDASNKDSTFTDSAHDGSENDDVIQNDDDNDRQDSNDDGDYSDNISVGDDDDSQDKETSESERIKALKLELKIQQIRDKREERRCKMQESNAAHAVARKNSEHLSQKHVHSALPTMHQANSDVLGFLQAFEKTLEILEVERSRWHIFLPAHLNANCMKIFSRLSVEHCSNYEVVKRELLMNSKISPRTNLENYAMQTESKRVSE